MAETAQVQAIPGELCIVESLPECDFCVDGTPGEYDFKTVFGPWAHGCERHWRAHRASETLGEGKGQKWVVQA